MLSLVIIYYDVRRNGEVVMSKYLSVIFIIIILTGEVNTC